MDSDNNPQKRKLELLSLRVQFVAALTGLLYIAAFSFGALLGFAYLLRHRFNPGGLTAADTLAMTMWSLGVLITLAVGLGYSTLAAYPLSRLLYQLVRACKWMLLRFRGDEPVVTSAFWWSVRFGAPNKLTWRSKQSVFLLMGSLTLLLVVGLAWRLTYPLKIFVGMLLVHGMFLAVVVFGRMNATYSPYPRREDRHTVDVHMNRLSLGKRGLVIAALVTVTLICLNLDVWLDTAALVIGFREQDVTVRLAKEDFEDMLDQATRNGIALNPCEQLVSGSSTVRHVDILWQGVGTKSLLRFPTQPLANEPFASNVIRAAVRSPSISNVITVPSKHACHELLAATLFEADGVRLRSQAGAKLAANIPWIENFQKGSKIRIIVHGDRHGTMSADVANGTQAQAATIKKLVEVVTHLPPSAVEVLGVGMNMPKLDCSTRLATQRDFCNIVNQRVEIQLLDPEQG